jgi:hypothetical protein
MEGQLHEGLLEVVLPGAGVELGHRAFGHRAAVRHDHHVVAEAFHLLHDVGGEHDALAVLVAQPAQGVAQRARGQHVQAVGRLVEDDVGRVVHQRARQRRLHALALAEAVGAPVQQRPHVQHLGQKFRRGPRRRPSSCPCSRP